MIGKISSFSANSVKYNFNSIKNTLQKQTADVFVKSDTSFQGRPNATMRLLKEIDGLIDDNGKLLEDIAHLIVGNVDFHLRKGDPELAIITADRIIEEAKSAIKNPDKVAKIYDKIGKIFTEHGYYGEAARYYWEGITYIQPGESPLTKQRLTEILHAIEPKAIRQELAKTAS